jgi:hypothetical protein
MTERRTSFERAMAEGFDHHFMLRMANALLDAIARESMVSDAPVMALRCGETCEALVMAFEAMLAMSPLDDAELKSFVERTAARVIKNVLAYRSDPDDFSNPFAPTKGSA